MNDKSKTLVYTEDHAIIFQQLGPIAAGSQTFSMAASLLNPVFPKAPSVKF